MTRWGFDEVDGDIVASEYPGGNWVRYTDHAAEMKEVLDALDDARDMLTSHPDFQEVGVLKDYDTVLDKYSHYLRKK